LALKANQTAECLYTPWVEKGRRWPRNYWVWRMMFFVGGWSNQTFNGYVMSQFRRCSLTSAIAGTVK